MNDWSRIAAVVRARRRALGLRQQDIAGRGGPSAALVRQVETGRYNAEMQPAMRRGYESALEWSSGAIDRLLAGEEGQLEVKVETEEYAQALERLLDLAPPDVLVRLLKEAARAIEDSPEFEGHVATATPEEAAASAEWRARRGDPVRDAEPSGPSVTVERFAEAARDIGSLSRGQQRRLDAQSAGEPAIDDPDDMEPR